MISLYITGIFLALTQGSSKFLTPEEHISLKQYVNDQYSTYARLEDSASLQYAVNLVSNHSENQRDYEEEWVSAMK